MATYAFNPFTGTFAPVVPGPIGPVGPEGSTGSVLLDELTAIYRNGSFSVGTPGQVPFGVGPVVPPGTAFHYISADAYNPIHLPSGSFC
jgi:hypothetical protein